MVALPAPKKKIHDTISWSNIPVPLYDYLKLLVSKDVYIYNMALGGSKFTSFESDTCHPSYSSVSYVDLPKRTPREPKIRNERNSHPIGRKNCLGNHFWPGVFLFLIGTFIKSWKISLSQMSSPLVPLAKYWRMLINRSWSCWEFPSSMHCKIGDDDVEHTPAFWSCWPFRQLPRYCFILLALHQHNKVLILQNISF